MIQLLVLAQSYEEHMAAGRFYERLGWIFGGLSVIGLVALIVGIVVRDIRNKRKSREGEGSD